MEEPVEVLEWGSVKQDQQDRLWVDREYFPCFLFSASICC